MRPRKATDVLALGGAFNKNPARLAAREGEPEPVGDIGPAPDHLNEKQRACYAEIVLQAHERVLCPADRVAVELAASLLADFRSDPAAFQTSRLGVLTTLLRAFGMTPADRSRVKARPAPKQNRFQEILNIGKRATP